MDKTFATSRRDLLKSGAVVAAPLAVSVPTAVLADDGSAAELARLKDERDIEALHRAALRRINGSTLAAAHLAPGLRAIAEVESEDATLNIAEDGLRATRRRAVTAEFQTEFTGHSTVERMARFEGQGSHRFSEPRVLAADYVKDQDGWRIAMLRLA